MSGTWTHGENRVHSRDGSFTLSIGSDRVYSFDLEGRPISWFEHGTLHKRSLASRVLGRRREHGQRRRWQASDDEAAQLFARLLHAVEQAATRPLAPEARGHLERALSWTPETLLAERGRFAAAYAPVSILPPDQYFAVVAQVTTGCSWNRCTFCTFYRDRPFTVRTPASFTQHLAAVGRLLGRGAALRRSLFLGDGNALMVANRKLLPLIGAARAAFPERDVYGFVDVFTGARKSVSEWRELAAAGLRRVYLGLETGHDPLLEWLDKPGGYEQSLEIITTLKQAGLSVAPIFMTGVGGATYARSHQSDTVSLIERLPLSAGDLVYLSPFVQHPGSPYQQRAESGGVIPLDPHRLEAQFGRLSEAVRRHHPGVRVARYDIQEFIY